MVYSRNSWVVSALAIGALASFAHQAQAEQVDLNEFVLDLSGSMSEFGTGTKTKLTLLKERANAHLLEIKQRSIPQKFEVRTFQDAGSVVAIPFNQNATADQVKTFVDGLVSPDGGTPLAGATCAGIDSLQNFELDYSNAHPDPDYFAYDKYLYVLTDGLENGTPSEGSENAQCDARCTRCQGTEPDAALMAAVPFNAFSLPPETWARKVFNTACGGEVDSVSESINPAMRVIVNTDAFFNFIGTGQSLLDVRQPEPLGFSRFFSSSPYTDEVTPGWESYFKKLSDHTGGRYTAVKPNAAGTGTVLSGSLVGDINKDGCVGKVDYNKLHQSDTWLKQVRADKPHLYAADLDQDGWVRAGDHRLLLANYGKGVCLPADL